MNVTAPCHRCLSRSECAQFYGTETETAVVKASLEIEVITEAKIGRLLVGRCEKSNESVAVDIGHLPPETPEGSSVPGIHNMRLVGLPTVTIDISQVEYAPHAPRIITELLDAMIG